MKTVFFGTFAAAFLLAAAVVAAPASITSGWHAAPAGVQLARGGETRDDDTGSTTVPG